MKAIGILKEEYDFIYKTGVPVIYLDIFDKHFKSGGVHLFIEAAGKYNYRDIIEYIERKRHGDVQDINMEEAFTTYFSNFLSLEELKSLVERIIDPNDENYTVMVVQPITMLTNKNYENFKYLLDKYSYTIPVDEEDAKEELYSYLWSIAKGKNEKIIDYALEYFIKSEGDKYLNIYLQAVIRALVRKKAPYEMINKYYEKFVIRTETDVFRIMQATYKNFDFFKRAIDNYMQNYRYIKVSPGIMEEVLHDCIVNKYYDSAKYLIQLGVKPIVDINNIRKLKNAEKTH